MDWSCSVTSITMRFLEKYCELHASRLRMSCSAHQAFCFTPKEVKPTPFSMFQGSVEIAVRNTKCSLPAAVYMKSFNHQVQPATQPQHQFLLISLLEVLACFGALFLQPHSCSVCDSSIPSNLSLQCDRGRGQNKRSFLVPPFPKLGEHQLGDSLV